MAQKSTHQSETRQSVRQPKRAPSLFPLVLTCTILISGCSQAVAYFLNHREYPAWEIMLFTGAFVVFGSIVASTILVILPWSQVQQRQRQAWHRYRDLLERFSFQDRKQTLDSLRLEGDDEVAQLSRAVYKILAEGIGANAEASRLRHTLNYEVEQKTKKATVQLNRLAHTDSLTGLANRRALEDSLSKLIEDARAQQQRVVCIMIDVDHFKEINDQLGHDEGDRVLVYLADTLRGSLRENDRAFRMGGDEFIVLLTHNTSNDAVREISERLHKRFARLTWSIAAENVVARPSLSMGGIAIPVSADITPQSLVKAADEALYKAKHNGRGHTQFELRSNNTPPSANAA